SGVQVGQRDGRTGGRVHVALGDHRVHHASQAHALTVLGGEDAGHAVGLQLGDLAGHDDPAAAAVDPHVAAALGPQPVDQVPEVLVVAALVGRHGYAL